MATYLWSHAGEWLQETGQDLHIFNASADDGGIYTCSIWVSGPSWGFLVSSASKSIMVHFSPRGLSTGGIDGAVLGPFLPLADAGAGYLLRRPGQGARDCRLPDPEPHYEGLCGLSQDIYATLEGLESAGTAGR
ncbi:hypothetical protein Y1Q_0005037 [Alligator mississippiensis]|uniref:Ig-like domain-containing protein n=1 Tax=Alligator mississippiensis TaxID=8496 RepID=A0A151MYM1_ALLMI|nr:hypothetical protein Y1Q_0005037 [Alligator mississippiensis]